MQQLYPPNKNLVLARKPSRMWLVEEVAVVMEVVEVRPCPLSPANSQTSSSSQCPRLLSMRRLTGKTKFIFPKLS